MAESNDTPTTIIKGEASASPLAVWIRAMGYDPSHLKRQEEIVHSFTLEMKNSIMSRTSESQHEDQSLHSTDVASNETEESASSASLMSGLSGLVGASAADVASASFDVGELSEITFGGKTGDANINILSIEDSSDTEDDDKEMIQSDFQKSFEDRAFAKNSTPVYEALRRQEWRQAMVFLTKGSFISRNMADGTLLKEPRIVPPEEQLRTWVSMYEGDGRMLWRRLPIHDALCRGAPPDLIEIMLQLHPASVQKRDWDGNLPLHLAMEHKADREVVEMILKEYPHAIEVRNDKGKLPLECVNQRGKETILHGEILQSYVSSAKQVANQEVPKLKDKLFEVNKTIEAAKSELRLAKVELGIIKQQEQMRIQNKEKEENRMKEEVERLRNELEVLRSEREDMITEKERWTEKAVVAKNQKDALVITISDSDDSQRSWIANEFTEMVSELERTTRQRTRPKSRAFDGSGSSAPVFRSSDVARGMSILRKKHDPSTSVDDYDLKETKTEATESSLDDLEQFNEDEGIASASDDSEESYGPKVLSKASSSASSSSSKALSKASSQSSIRSIREQLKQSRRDLNSHFSSEDGGEKPGRGSKKVGKLSSSEDGSENPGLGFKKFGSRTRSDDRGEELTERIRRLESRSSSSDRGDPMEERLKKIESGSSSDSGERVGRDPEQQVSVESDHGYTHDPAKTLNMLDHRLSGVLHGKKEALEPEGISHSGSSGVSSVGSGSSHLRDNLRECKHEEVIQVNHFNSDLNDQQREELLRISSKLSAASSRRSGFSDPDGTILPHVESKNPTAGLSVSKVKTIEIVESHINIVSSGGSMDSSRARSFDEFGGHNGSVLPRHHINKSPTVNTRSGDAGKYDFVGSQDEDLVPVGSKGSTTSSRSGRLSTGSKTKTKTSSQPEQVVQIGTMHSAASSISGRMPKGSKSDSKTKTSSQPERVVHVGTMDSSASSISVRSSSSTKLEMGLAMVARKTPTNAFWKHSMADDLTCQEDTDDEHSSGQVLNPLEEKWKPEEYPISEVGPVKSEETKANKLLLVGECRDELTKKAVLVEERRDEALAARPPRPCVTFAEDAIVYEDEERDSFSPQFRRFDYQVDKAMTRITGKTHKVGSRRSGDRSRSRRGGSHSKSRSKQSQSQEHSRKHIYVTTVDNIEILGSGVSPSPLETARSSNSVNTEPKRNTKSMTGSNSDVETGYSSER